MIERRWFQFSLRGFLIAVAVFAICFGHTVEKARRRGSALDAIVAAGGEVTYQPDVELTNKSSWWPITSDHLWFDVEQRRVRVYLPENVTLDAALGRNLKCACPIDQLIVGPAVVDDWLSHLHGIAEVRELDLWDNELASQGALKELGAACPEVDIWPPVDRD